MAFINSSADRNKNSNRFWTVPNFLCILRFIGSPFLILTAIASQPQIFFWLYIFLALTDWLDGKLAIFLNQRSEFGARLDSWADALLYTCLTAGCFILYSTELSKELIWIVPALASYAISTLFGIYKFHRWPSYHTRLAKTSWLFIIVGFVSFLGGWSIWPLRVAMVAVFITNLESILISYRLQEWQANVSSLSQAVQSQDQSNTEKAR